MTLLHCVPVVPQVSLVMPPINAETGDCCSGDVVGALLNRATKTISFVKNGIDLGIAFRDVQEERLFPSVGMRTPDEEVDLFVNDVSAYRQS